MLAAGTNDNHVPQSSSETSARKVGASSRIQGRSSDWVASSSNLIYSAALCVFLLRYSLAERLHELIGFRKVLR